MTMVTGHAEKIAQAQQVKTNMPFVPMFPAFVNYSKDKFDHGRAPRSEFIRTELAKIFDIAFADPEDATVVDQKWNLSGFPTAHSLRASAVLWALRCHCPEYRAKRCGRWLGGGDANWSRYAQNGSTERKTYLENRQMDPVFSLWRFTDNVCADVLSFQR